MKTTLLQAKLPNSRKLKLMERCDDAENLSRRENICIICLKVGSDGQSGVKFFESWLPEVLGIKTKPGIVN